MPGDVMEFTTSKQSGDVEKRIEIPFQLDGVPMIAYVPTDTQAVMFYRLVSRTATLADRLNGALEFLEQTIEPASFERIRRRVLDPSDPFDLDPGLSDLLKWIAEEYKTRADNPEPELPAAAPAGPPKMERKPAMKAAAKKK